MRTPTPEPKRSIPLAIWLVAAFVVTIGVTGATSTAVGVYLIGRGITDQAQDKARLDLNSARLVYLGRLESVRAALELSSLRPSLLDAVLRREGDRASALLAAKAEGRLDYVALVDPGEAPSTWGPVVSDVMRGRPTSVATVLKTEEALARISPGLAERARVVLRTPEALELPPREIHLGLVIEGASAIRDDAGGLAAVLVGGVLLNHEAQTVDRIRDTIYEGEAFEGKPVGGATLCLGDVRIATNMMLRDGARAVGTTVDPAVKKRVLEHNAPLVDRANVLGRAYFTAYEPIRDPEGRPVGILSLGIPEEKYTKLRKEALAAFLGLVLFGTAASAGVAAWIGRIILRPVRVLASAMRQYEQGELDAPTEPLARAPAELASLVTGFHAMARTLHERDLQLKYRTEEQLGKTERLAMIGRLSAGVAHEINNPLGGILLFASLLLKQAPKDSSQREGLERICNETKRCQLIVQRLLDFARPREPKLERTVIEQVLERSLQLVAGQSMFHNIAVVKQYEQPAPTASVDPAQLQQVLLNLIVNAAEAMDGRGTLTLVTETVENGRSAQIVVGDTGCGIAREHLDRLFEPFFTTKEGGRGTGLGLSISRGIVETHRGTIWAESGVGEGTSFFVRLPVSEG
jgi:two-component system, NtrC family, sensor kinase